ncbi:MAG: acyl carrier protein [Dehalococcoidia bacterium]
MDSRQKIRQFIKENFLFTDDDSALVDGDSLMMKGVIDSTGALEVIMFLEETFGFEVGEEEMIPENLDSVDNLVDYVKRKTTAAA